MQRGMDPAQSTSVRHEVGLHGDARQPLVSGVMVGDQQQIIGHQGKRVSHAIDNAPAPDTFQAFWQSAVPGRGATGEDYTGAGKAHVIPGSGGFAVVRSPRAQ